MVKHTDYGRLVKKSPYFWGPRHIQKTTFGPENQYFNDKLSLFLTKVSFDTSEGNQWSYFH